MGGGPHLAHPFVHNLYSLKAHPLLWLNQVTFPFLGQYTDPVSLPYSSQFSPSPESVYSWTPGQAQHLLKLETPRAGGVYLCYQRFLMGTLSCHLPQELEFGWLAQLPI